MVNTPLSATEKRARLASKVPVRLGSSGSHGAAGRIRQSALLLLLILLVGVLVGCSSTFRSHQNLMLILEQNSAIGIVGRRSNSSSTTGSVD